MGAGRVVEDACGYLPAGLVVFDAAPVYPDLEHGAALAALRLLCAAHSMNFSDQVGLDALEKSRREMLHVGEFKAHPRSARPGQHAQNLVVDGAARQQGRDEEAPISVPELDEEPKAVHDRHEVALDLGRMVSPQLYENVSRGFSPRYELVEVVGKVGVLRLDGPESAALQRRKEALDSRLCGGGGVAHKRGGGKLTEYRGAGLHALEGPVDPLVEIHDAVVVGVERAHQRLGVFCARKVAAAGRAILRCQGRDERGHVQAGLVDGGRGPGAAGGGGGGGGDTCPVGRAGATTRLLGLAGPGRAAVVRVRVKQPLELGARRPVNAVVVNHGADGVDEPLRFQDDGLGACGRSRKVHADAERAKALEHLGHILRENVLLLGHDFDLADGDLLAQRKLAPALVLVCGGRRCAGLLQSPRAVATRTDLVADCEPTSRK